MIKHDPGNPKPVFVYLNLRYCACSKLSKGNIVREPIVEIEEVDRYQTGNTTNGFGNHLQAKGKVAASQNFVTRYLKSHFGDLSPDMLVRISQIRDEERINRLLERLFDLKSLKEAEEVLRKL